MRRIEPAVEFVRRNRVVDDPSHALEYEPLSLFTTHFFIFFDVASTKPIPPPEPDTIWDERDQAPEGPRDPFNGALQTNDHLVPVTTRSNQPGYLPDAAAKTDGKQPQ